MVIGYKEYLVKGGSLEPKGSRNMAFPLNRREEANGIRRDKTVVSKLVGDKGGGGGKKTPLETYCVTMRVKPKDREETSKVVVTSYIPDPALDMFQIGRLSVRQNDLCLRGPLTSNSRGQVRVYFLSTLRLAKRVVKKVVRNEEGETPALKWISRKLNFLSSPASLPVAPHPSNALNPSCSSLVLRPRQPLRRPDNVRAHPPLQGLDLRRRLRQQA